VQLEEGDASNSNQRSFAKSGGRERERDEDLSSEYSWLSDNYKTISLGGLDGATVAFISVSAGYGLGLHYIYIFILGASVLTGCSFYILINEFLSSKAIRDYLETEKRLNGIRFLHEKTDDISLMTKAFSDKGMPRAEAENVVQTLSQYNVLFVDLKMALKFGQNSEMIDDYPNLFFESFVMQLSYLVFGLAVVCTYLTPIFIPIADELLFLICCCVLTFIIATISSMKRVFTYQSWLSCFFESALTIAVAAPVAYLISAELATLLESYSPASTVENQ
jgi:hypothetical protein